MLVVFAGRCRARRVGEWCLVLFAVHLVCARVAGSHIEYTKNYFLNTEQSNQAENGTMAWNHEHVKQKCVCVWIADTDTRLFDNQHGAHKWKNKHMSNE